jgi:hypothetical protein
MSTYPLSVWNSSDLTKRHHKISSRSGTFFLGTAIIYMILSFEPAFAEQDTINATLYSQLVGLQFIRAKKVLVCHLLLVVKP